MRLLVLALLAAGCRKPDPAPTDLDGLLHFFWGQWEAGEDPSLAEGLRNLDAAVDGAGLQEVLEGTLTDLEPAEVEPARDPSLAQGLFMVRSFDCTLGALEDVLAALDQAALYPGVYDSYTRTYTSDEEAFGRRETPFLTWDLDYTATIPLGDAYTAHAHGGLRYVPDQGDLTPWGPFLVSRTFMPEPAAFPEGSANSLDQDYQVEVFWERSLGLMLHAYGMWRQGVFTLGLSMDDPGVQNTVLNNMADWDDVTVGHCASSR